MMRTTEFAARAEPAPDSSAPALPFRPVTLRQRNRHGFTIHTKHYYASSVEVERRLGRYLGYTEIGLD